MTKQFLEHFLKLYILLKIVMTHCLKSDYKSDAKTRLPNKGNANNLRNFFFISQHYLLLTQYNLPMIFNS